MTMAVVRVLGSDCFANSIGRRNTNDSDLATGLAIEQNQWWAEQEQRYPPSRMFLDAAVARSKDIESCWFDVCC